MMEILFSVIVLSVLSSGFLLLLKKLGLFSSSVALLFCIALALHLGVALVIHYAEFYPFGGGQGDQHLYHDAAVMISGDFQQGIFSAERIEKTLAFYRMQHWYPVFVGMVYAITVPALIVGKMLSVWFAAAAIALLFLIAKELGASERGAFAAGFIASLYPSFLYFGSLLIRESAIVFVVLLASLLLVKLIREFSWERFLFLYAVFLLLVHLRFYVGLAIILVAGISLFFFQRISWRERMREGLVAVLLLGFIPQFFGYGYYGIQTFVTFLRPEKIQTYRETAYVPRDIPVTKQSEPARSEPAKLPPVKPAPINQELATQEPVKPVLSPITQELGGEASRRPSGADSTVIVRVDMKNPIIFMGQNLVSFAYVAIGPFPWHISNTRQLFVLFETIPWLTLLSLAVLGAFSSFRTTWRRLLPLILTAFGLIVMISLFMDNFGVYTRIRMPAFLLLMTLIPLSFPLLERLKRNI